MTKLMSTKIYPSETSGHHVIYLFCSSDFRLTFGCVSKGLVSVGAVGAIAPTVFEKIPYEPIGF